MANANINNIVKRSSKNRPLTFQEGDQNLEELINVIEDQQDFEAAQGQTNSALSQSISDLGEDVSGATDRLSLAEQDIDDLKQFETNLSDGSSGSGSDLIAYTGTEETVTEALDKRTIYVGSVAEGLNGLTVSDGTEVSVTSWHDGFSVLSDYNPKGGGEFVYLSSISKTAHNGGTVVSPTVPAVSSQAGSTKTERAANFLAGAGETDPSGTGVFVRKMPEGGEIYDIHFGALHNGENESAIIQAALDALDDGGTLVLTGECVAYGLTSNKNAIKVKSDSATNGFYPTGFNVNADNETVLAIGGFEWELTEISIRDSRQALGSTGVGVRGISFVRSDSSKDLDAVVKGCSFSRLDTAIYGAGANVQIMDNTFSYCRYFVDAEQQGTLDFRGWRIHDNRFHGRNFSGGSAIRFGVNSFGQQIVDNYFDDVYAAFTGALGRRSAFADNEIQGAFTPDYAVDVTSGDYYSITGNYGGSFSGGGIRATGTGATIQNNPNLNSIRKHGIYLTSFTNGTVSGNKLRNVNSVSDTDGDIYDGIYIDANSNSNEITDNLAFQVGAKGRYGINNQGNGNYFNHNKAALFNVGKYNQSTTTTSYGDTEASVATTRHQEGTAPPSTGTWRKGDKIWNTNPGYAGTGGSVYVIIGWICVGAGAPGTWAEMRTFTGD